MLDIGLECTTGRFYLLLASDIAVHCIISRQTMSIRSPIVDLYLLIDKRRGFNVQHVHVANLGTR